MYFDSMVRKLAQSSIASGIRSLFAGHNTTAVKIRSWLALKPRFPVEPADLPGFDSFNFRRGTSYGSNWNWPARPPHKYGTFSNQPPGYFHAGLDIFEYRRKDGAVVPIPFGTPIRAVFSGKVVRRIEDTSITHGVTIEGPDGKCLTYNHIAASVNEGDQVQQGEAIGTLVNEPIHRTPHLHFEVEWQVPGSLARLDEWEFKRTESFDPLALWPRLPVKTEADS